MKHLKRLIVVFKGRYFLPSLQVLQDEKCTARHRLQRTLGRNLFANNEA